MSTGFCVVNGQLVSGDSAAGDDRPTNAPAADFRERFLEPYVALASMINDEDWEQVEHLANTIAHLARVRLLDRHSDGDGVVIGAPGGAAY